MDRAKTIRIRRSLCLARFRDSSRFELRFPLQDGRFEDRMAIYRFQRDLVVGRFKRPLKSRNMPGVDLVHLAQCKFCLAVGANQTPDQDARICRYEAHSHVLGPSRNFYFAVRIRHDYSLTMQTLFDRLEPQWTPADMRSRNVERCPGGIKG